MRQSLVYVDTNGCYGPAEGMYLLNLDTGERLSEWQHALDTEERLRVWVMRNAARYESRAVVVASDAVILTPHHVTGIDELLRHKGG